LPKELINMASYNRVILLGNLTRDPQLRYISSTGTAVTDIGLAVNDRRKDANGQWIEEPTFVDVTLWGRTAEVASEYLSKGSPVLIEGRLKLDTWQSKDGQKQSKLKVVGERMQLLGSRGGGGGGAGGGAAPRRQDSEYSQAVPPQENEGYDEPSYGAGGPGGGEGGEPDDGIPF
jgi:single-strand DNA-binding protein